MVRITTFGIGLIVISLLCSACGSGQPLPATIYPALGITETPGVLDCSDIVKAHGENNADEWEGQKIALRGSGFYYTGKVNTVTETHVVHLSGDLCHATLHHVPHDVVLGLKKGQYVEGYGTVKNISFYLGEDIDIEVNPDLLFVREEQP